VPQGALITWALMMEGGLQVNLRGERFHYETQGCSEAAVHLLAQPGGVAWNVFDDHLLALGRTWCAAASAPVPRWSGSRTRPSRSAAATSTARPWCGWPRSAASFAPHSMRGTTRRR
jgi:hypothetical protein